MAEFLASEAGDRRVVVVNTHHHWDHVFGNAAFAGADIVAQRGCPRLIQAELQSGDESRAAAAVGGRARCPTSRSATGSPTSTTGESVHLIHTPGHSEDSLVVFLTESRLLLGGDTVEWPLPNFGQRDGARRVGADAAPAQAAAGRPRRARRTGRRWTSRSSTPTSATSAGVYEAVAAAKAAGAGRGELDLPAERFLADGVAVDDVYAAAHRENLLWAWDEV